MQPREYLPRRETVGVAALIVVVAVVVRSGYALLQGTAVDPQETLAFALIFAVCYFGTLQLLDSGESDQES